MKSFKSKRWTLQLYWPDVYLGRGRHFGIRCCTGFMVNLYADGVSAGFEILGFGLGLLYIKAS